MAYDSETPGYSGVRLYTYGDMGSQRENVYFIVKYGQFNYQIAFRNKSLC